LDDLTGPDHGTVQPPLHVAWSGLTGRRVNLNDLHRRLPQDVLAIGNTFPFVITGGYAVQAHGLVDRLSRDIDVATDSSLSMDSLASQMVAGLTARGWQVRIIGVEPLSARFMVTDPELGEECEVDILKEAFNRPPKDTPYGPVLALAELESLGRGVWTDR
jgi:hypothetical protein